MKLQDCQPGTRVVIAMKYLELGLGGGHATVAVAEPPEQLERRRAVDCLADELWMGDYDGGAYPHGMVQVDLDDELAPEYPSRSPWFDAADLNPLPACETHP